MQKSYCYTVAVSVHMLNVRANVKVFEFRFFCIFCFTLPLFIILIKPLTTKAYDSCASGDCGTSGYNAHFVVKKDKNLIRKKKD